MMIGIFYIKATALEDFVIDLCVRSAGYWKQFDGSKIEFLCESQAISLDSMDRIPYNLPPD